jgi:NAD(P)-dependent dehydrogenase (short-subunit alcohol dehydrogenase family)
VAGLDAGAAVTGPHVVITGAARGIGHELARQYLRAGWDVTVGVRRPDALDLPPEIARDALDLEDPAAIEAFAARIRSPVDVLVNNAGLFGPRPQTIADVDAAVWSRVLMVNTIAPVLLARALLEPIAASERRVIATLTSRMGSFHENTTGGIAMYRSSKAALNMAMQCLAFEVTERGVGVLLVHPGWVRTAMGTTAADLDVQESATGVRAVIDAFRPSEGLAFRAWDGRDIPW